MREFTVPPLANVPPDTNITDLVLRQAAKASNPALFSRLDAAGQWQDIAAKDFLADVSALAKGLIASGVQAGDRVGIMSRTRYEWALVDFAIWFAGGVSVPIYETSSPSQVAWNLGDSGAVAAFGESAHHENVIRQAASLRGAHRPGPCVAARRRAASTPSAPPEPDVSDDDLEARRQPPSSTTCHHHLHLRERRAAPRAANSPTATSWNCPRTLWPPRCARSSTSRPGPSCSSRWRTSSRGSSRSCRSQQASPWPTRPTSSTCCPICRATSPPSSLPCRACSRRCTTRPSPRQRTAARARSSTRPRTRPSPIPAPGRTAAIGFGLKIKHAIFDRLVYSKLRAAMGGHVAHAVSGGGPLGERLGHFFQGIGLQILEGYGLTETTAPVSVNTPERIKIGTVGAPASRQHRQDCRRRRDPHQGHLRHARLLQA